MPGEPKIVAAERGAWICFEDEAGHTLRPPKAPHLGSARPDTGDCGVR